MYHWKGTHYFNYGPCNSLKKKSFRVEREGSQGWSAYCEAKDMSYSQHWMAPTAPAIEATPIP